MAGARLLDFRPAGNAGHHRRREVPMPLKRLSTDWWHIGRFAHTVAGGTPPEQRALARQVPRDAIGPLGARTLSPGPTISGPSPALMWVTLSGWVLASPSAD